MQAVQVAPTDRLNSPSSLLLTRLRAAHQEVLACVELMKDVTRSASPDVRQLTSARLKISQASLARRAVWHSIRGLLQPNVRPVDATVLRELTEADLRLFGESSAHISRWTVEAIQADWIGYQDASRRIRGQMVDAIKLEQSLLYPMLQE